VELNALSIGSSHHREGGADILEPDQVADLRSFDCRLALEREAKLDEERLHGFEIVDNDEDVVHSCDGHILLSRFTAGVFQNVCTGVNQLGGFVMVLQGGWRGASRTGRKYSAMR